MRAALVTIIFTGSTSLSTGYAASLLSGEPRGFALDFINMAYAVDTAVGAEIALGAEEGFALDFVDEFGISYAIRG